MNECDHQTVFLMKIQNHFNSVSSVETAYPILIDSDVSMFLDHYCLRKYNESINVEIEESSYVGKAIKLTLLVENDSLYNVKIAHNHLGKVVLYSALFNVSSQNMSSIEFLDVVYR